ncbi:hypothetical protein [Nostocoides veronense]
MKRMLTGIAATTLAIAGMGMGAGSATAAPATVCTGTLTGSYPAIFVPVGATCTLDGAKVSGNVTVSEGATLMTKDATIRLNVKGNEAAKVNIIDTDVWGQIHFRRTTGEIIIGNDGCKVDPNAGGNINLQNNFGPIAICQMTIKNNIILHNNHHRIGVFDNRVGNNIQVYGNDSPAIRLRDNVVRGNLALFSNTVKIAFVAKNNTMGGKANCSGNVIAPTGNGNVASGGLAGQCASLG